MAKKHTKVILALIILLFAFLSGTLWAKGWNDEVSRSQGVMVFFITYQDLQPQDRQLIINDLRLHADSQVRLFARHYYGKGAQNRDQVDIQFKEPNDKNWSSPMPTPAVRACIERNKSQILAQLYSRMR